MFSWRFILKPKSDPISYFDCKLLRSIFLPFNLSLEVRLFRGIVRISCWFDGANNACNFPQSHCLVSLSIRSLTYRGDGEGPKKTSAWGSHLCEATSICLPSPTCHLVPFTRISLAMSKLCHTNEGLLPTLASKKEQFVKCLALYTL